MGAHNLSSFSSSTDATRNLKGKSMFGEQAVSNRRSSPAHGFGSSTRLHASKIYVGPEHAKTSSISVTPGPDYETVGACGNQADSGKISPAQWRFGTQQRFGQLRSTRGSLSPGPGEYENAGAFGKQGLSNRSSFPLYGFGTQGRFQAADKVFISPAHSASSYGMGSPGPAASYHKAGGLAGPKYGFGTDDRFQSLARKLTDSSEAPGPGSYSLDTTLGSQSSSRMTTQPKFGFGSSNRHHAERVFISSLHAKASPSAFSVSPGPSVYSPASSIGRQATSRGRSAPTWGFGRANRFDAKTYTTDTPGPGSYAI